MKFGLFQDRRGAQAVRPSKPIWSASRCARARWRPSPVADARCARCCPARRSCGPAVERNPAVGRHVQAAGRNKVTRRWRAQSKDIPDADEVSTEDDRRWDDVVEPGRRAVRSSCFRAPRPRRFNKPRDWPQPDRPAGRVVRIGNRSKHSRQCVERARFRVQSQRGGGFALCGYAAAKLAQPRLGFAI